MIDVPFEWRDPDDEVEDDLDFDFEFFEVLDLEDLELEDDLVVEEDEDDRILGRGLSEIVSTLLEALNSAFCSSILFLIVSNFLSFSCRISSSTRCLSCAALRFSASILCLSSSSFLCSSSSLSFSSCAILSFSAFNLWSNNSTADG